MTSLPPIVVVSGLPRSGTSLLMQMLQAGGAPLLADDIRLADADNPRGYFEYEPVKRLPSNQSWMDEAVGKCLKVVSPLLPYLPQGYSYRIVFIDRDLAEVVQSQRAMLARTDQPGSTLTAAELAAAYSRQLAVLETVIATRRDFSVHRVEHRKLLADPAGETAKLVQFVSPVWTKLQLAAAAMAEVIDPQLYRQRHDA